MSELKAFLLELLAAVVRVTLWLLAAVLAVFLVSLALLLLFLGFLWALVRGRRPQPPVFVGRFQRFTAERVWPRSGPAGWGRGAAEKTTEVVDVQVREVADGVEDAGSTASPATDPSDKERRGAPPH